MSVETALARHVKNIQCPKCAENGRDRSKNNLGVFDDGSQYCWSCGYWVKPSGMGSRVNERVSRSVDVVGQPRKDVVVLSLPDDVEPYYPSRCIEWVGHYGLNVNDLYANRVLWSEIYQRLIFPYYEGFGTDVQGGLLGWQGRDFREGADDKRRPKWFGRGSLDNLYHIFNRERQRDSLVVVEDIVSAIKVSKLGIAVFPLFGSHISSRRLIHLKLLTSRLLIFLDPDKYAESVKFSHKANVLGLPSSVVASHCDPKELSLDELKEKLNGY